MTVPVAASVSLGPLTTLRVGGPAARFARVTSLAELEAAVAEADARSEPVFVLGGGSNVVVDDAGFPGLVIHVALAGIEVSRAGADVLLTVAAGESWDGLVARAVGEGYSGLECMSGIPGLVGATPMQNVGAYGQEVGDTIVRVRALDRVTGRLVELDREACGFSYRSSVFKGSARHVIVEVTFALKADKLAAPIRYGELAKVLGMNSDQPRESARAPLAVVRDVVIALRRGKGMVIDADDPESVSAGSFFVNPILDADELALLEARLAGEDAMPRFAAPGGLTKLSAGWLIEHAGFAKGYTRGNVGISRKHALALVNRGGATAREILDLAETIKDGVRARFGVELAREPVLISG